jgi:hypothetical protein
MDGRRIDILNTKYGQLEDMARFRKYCERTFGFGKKMVLSTFDNLALVVINGII